MYNDNRDSEFVGVGDWEGVESLFTGSFISKEIGKCDPKWSAGIYSRFSSLFTRITFARNRKPVNTKYLFLNYNLKRVHPDSGL